MIHAALTSYERESFLRITAGSLALAPPSHSWELHVYDDASPSLSIELLRGLFPQAVNVTRRPENLGADRNMREVMLDFLRSHATHLLLLDGDLLLNTDWCDRASEVLKHDVGVLSLYNSALHVTFDTVSVGAELVAIKRDLGGAGTIFARDLVQAIVENVPPSSTYDWDWSHFLTRRGIKLYALQNSAVQHIGLAGTNSINGSVDFGLGFVPDCRYNLLQCIDFIERLLLQKTIANSEQQQRIQYFESRPAAIVAKYARRPWRIPRRIVSIAVRALRQWNSLVRLL